MKRPMFSDLLSEITRMIISQPDFDDCIKVLGIDPNDWPQCRARDLALSARKLRDDGNSFESVRYMMAESARNLPRCDDFPSEPQVLRDQYAKLLANHKWQNFALQVSQAKSSEEIEAAYRSFENPSLKSIEVFEFSQELDAIVETNREQVAAGKSLVRLPGWPLLSEMIGGFNPGRTTLLIAPTGFGKTNLGTVLGLAAADVGGVLFVNMEMSKQDLGEKFFMSTADMAFSDLKRGKYTDAEVNFAKQKLTRKYPIYFTGGKTLSVDQIYAAARRCKAAGMQFMFVDYDQKIRVETDRNTQEWKALQIAVEQIEQLAIELDIWICIMAQADQMGDPAASKRMKNSMSTCLHFHKDSEGHNILHAIKNRFGIHGAAVQVNYEPAKAYASEAGSYDVRAAREEKRASKQI